MRAYCPEFGRIAAAVCPAGTPGLPVLPYKKTELRGGFRNSVKIPRFPKLFPLKGIIAALPFSGGCHNIREFFQNTHPRICGPSDFIPLFTGWDFLYTAEVCGMFSAFSRRCPFAPIFRFSTEKAREPGNFFQRSCRKHIETQTPAERKSCVRSLSGS